ncbi:MAG: tetraacyldisaccharide 4'-kinase, partial [Methylophilaceae bacterium]|nr:tetraacyldisaccharide 4'-kinase [Methylophilaceae bacterium]
LGILKSYRSQVPIIVIGNITVGGTGKTPLVIWLTDQLKRAGFTPGIISRGYGVNNHQSIEVALDALPGEVGDEPVLLARRTGCPVFVNIDRVSAAKSLLQVYPACDVIISDDGMQHYRMQRDIELVVVDAARSFGNQMLLPAGPLREPVSRLKQVDAVIYNGRPTDLAGFEMVLQATTIRRVDDPRIEASLDVLANVPIKAVAGIGNPKRFFQQLRELQLGIEEHVFPDHHAYRLEDLAFDGDAVVLMTEKDAVKCAPFAKQNWWYLPVDAVVDKALADYIVQKLRK